MLNYLKSLMQGNTQVQVTHDMQQLVRGMHFELIPISTMENAIAALAPNSPVAVTCSLNKGLGITQKYSEQLLQLGHQPVPHIAARMVESKDHAKQLAKWLKDAGLQSVFVPGGDAPEPFGPYNSSLEFLEDFLNFDSGVTRIGVTGYPDGHALIGKEQLDEQLHAKAQLLAKSGMNGWISTQMCFDDLAVETWIRGIREQGIDLPIWLGMAGVVDRLKLMNVSARLGIGASVRFLKSNKSTVLKLISPGGFDPTYSLAFLANHADALNIESIHCFTFNSVTETRTWQNKILQAQR